MTRLGEYLYTITEYERDGKPMYTLFIHKTSELREGRDLAKMLRELEREVKR